MGDISKKLRELRISKGLMQKAISQELKIDVKDYRRYEQGKIKLQEIPPEHIEEIERFYKIGIDQLIESRIDKSFKFIKNQLKLFFLDNKGSVFGIMSAFVLIITFVSIFVEIPPIIKWGDTKDETSSSQSEGASETEPLTSNAATEEVDYFISLAISDTLSDNLEPTKKIVATASADTSNMTISSKTATAEYGPFNMTKESERRFIFLAVFEETATFDLTITAYSQDGKSTIKEFAIEN